MPNVSDHRLLFSRDVWLELYNLCVKDSADRGKPSCCPAGRQLYSITRKTLKI